MKEELQVEIKFQIPVAQNTCSSGSENIWDHLLDQFENANVPETSLT